MNDALVKQVDFLERQFWRKTQYSRRECVQIKGMPDSVAHGDLSKMMCKALHYIGADTCEEKIKSCHHLNKKSDHTIVKFLGGKTENR